MHPVSIDLWGAFWYDKIKFTPNKGEITYEWIFTDSGIEGGIVNGMTATDIQKILNLKHAWEFILDKDVILLFSPIITWLHMDKGFLWSLKNTFPISKNCLYNTMKMIKQKSFQDLLKKIAGKTSDRIELT